ncbi:MAG: GrrA/OscA1 family cyclophane-containing rSAM-modified RiPP [Cyanobacteriota bacterium]|nr:GrrA/OscA1 family cyclophane-containing rSAM-modified RiPP [Cyanobacteriota bacterium]
MNRSLIAFQALLASSAVLCQTAEASSAYSAPDQLHNSIDARIDSVRNGDWSSLLKTVDNDGELVAKSKWGNGGGHKFSNSRGSGNWKNGKGGNKWSNSRNSWGNGGYHGGWRNGGGGWRNGGGGGGFVNW